MSKYIDELTELICDTVRTVFPNASLDDGYDVADEVIAKLPTIEVSEEVLKATKNFNCYTIADENAEMGMRTEIEPIIEVSEDYVSREYALEVIDDCINYPTNGDKACAIKNAQRVVPSEDCISRAEVIAEFERRKDKLYEDDYFDELMWIIENITDVVPSRAEGEWTGDESLAQCSNCGHWGKSIEHYCPNCEAKMKGEEE